MLEKSGLYRPSLQKDFCSWNDFYSVLETSKGTESISMIWRYWSKSKILISSPLGPPYDFSLYTMNPSILYFMVFLSLSSMDQVGDQVIWSKDLPWLGDQFSTCERWFYLPKRSEEPVNFSSSRGSIIQISVYLHNKLIWWNMNSSKLFIYISIWDCVLKWNTPARMSS